MHNRPRTQPSDAATEEAKRKAAEEKAALYEVRSLPEWMFILQRSDEQQWAAVAKFIVRGSGSVGLILGVVVCLFFPHILLATGVCGIAMDYDDCGLSKMMVMMMTMVVVKSTTAPWHSSSFFVFCSLSSSPPLPVGNIHRVVERTKKKKGSKEICVTSICMYKRGEERRVVMSFFSL